MEPPGGRACPAKARKENERALRRLGEKKPSLVCGRRSWALNKKKNQTRRKAQSLEQPTKRKGLIELKGSVKMEQKKRKEKLPKSINNR